MTPLSLLSSSTTVSSQSQPVGGMVLVDGSLQDLDSLLQQLAGRAELLVVDPHQDPLVQIQAALQGRARFNLHWIGSAGENGRSAAGLNLNLNTFALPPESSLYTYCWDGANLTVASAVASDPLPGELVVVDGGVQDLPALLADLARQDRTRTLLLLDSAGDPTAQLIDALQNSPTTYSAIHLISHGNSGRLMLGEQQLDLADPAANKSLWSSINSSLTPDGDLLLYGCNVASNEQDQRSLELLAGLTAADIAASSDLTGQGGDWSLEFSSGNVQTKALSLENWQGTLICVPDGQTEAFYKSRFIVASFHSAFYRARGGGWYVAGETIDADGAGNVTTPKLLVPENGYTYTGALLDVAAVGEFAIQHFALTTEGLWAWGGEGSALNDDLTSGTAFQKVAGVGADVPGPIDFSKARFISACTLGGIAVVMQDGSVWMNVPGSSDVAMYGDGSSGSIDGSWRQVKLNSSTPLTGITDLEVGRKGVFAYGNGKYYAWGPNVHMGDGNTDVSRNYATEIPSPLPAGVDFVQLQVTSGADPVDFNGATDGITMFVLGSDGFIYVLGDNGAGQAGIGSASAEAKAWTKVLNPNGTAPLGSVEFISGQNSSGEYNPTTSAVLQDGTLLSWGYNEKSQIGLPDDAAYYLPAAPQWENGAQPVFIVENGGHFTALVVRDRVGEIGTVGHNAAGAFGDGTTEDKTAYTVLPFSYEDGEGFAGDQCDVLLDVNNVTVNEASPFAVFSLTAEAGEELSLALTSGTARIGLDTDYQIQFWDPTADEGAGAWIDYTGPFVIPDGIGGDDAVPLLVRVAIQQDPHFERGESFNLEAAYTDSGASAIGIGTIRDDGTGDLYGPDSTDGLPDQPGENGLPGDQIRDDDRPLEVAGSIVNENSPYLTWTVSGEQGQPLSLELSSGSATYGTDTGRQLQFFDGSDWVDYVPGSSIVIPGSDSGAAGDLHLRLAVKPDDLSELSESLLLTARNASGAPFSAEGTILDQGGLLIDPDATPLAVNDLTVNEGSPYAIFTVSGVEGQPLKLELRSGTAELGTDTGTQLQVFDGTNWVNYTPGSTVTIPGDGNGTPGEPAALLVRIAIKNDTPAEGPETFFLTATTGGLSTTGTATILDDGTGEFYGTENTDGQPDNPGQNGLDPDLEPDNDLFNNPAVSDVEVNEGSPYVIFTIQGLPGAGLDLWLQNLSAEDADHGSGIEVFDPVLDIWVPYDSDSTVIPEDGVLLARVSLNNDAPFEGPEQFRLNAAYNDIGVTEDVNVGGSDSGIATILDDGTGELFLSRDDDPETPEDETDPGVNDFNEPEIDRFSPKDDDRPLSISDVEVNEASPYAVFTVTAVEGQQLLLDLASGNATIGQDTGTQLEYYNGSAWVAYTPGTPITVPSGGTGASNEAVPLLVRVAIQQDLNYEGPESFNLIATYPSSGKEATGTGTILDDGSGNLYGPTNRDGQPDLPGENGVPEGLIKDDDRPLEVAGTTVNESSPFVAWTVSGIQGQALSLELGGGSAIAGTDTGTQLQVWDGDSWENYVPGSLITIPGSASGEPGDLQVRLAVKPDNLSELAETLDLIARNVSGSEFSGTSTILDQGGAVIDPSAKPLTVNDVTVNEGSPYAVFTVGGVEGQALSLELASLSATIGTDTGSQLQIFDGSNWVNYTPGSTVTIPSDGDGTAGEPAALLVRVAITNDEPAEGPETFTLTASSGGLRTVGVGTIVDDGTGDLYGPSNRDGQPDQPGENGLPLSLVKDNDLGGNPSVSDVEVNEGSPYVVYTIEGVPGAGVTLSLVDGTSEPADHGSGIEVFDPLLDAWVAYDPASTVIPEDGVLLARVALNNDAPFEGPETLGLEVTYNANGETDGITVGGAGTGTATILDDGTGEIFLTNEDDPGTPEDESNLGVNDRLEPEIDRFSPKDDDRPLSISDVEVNEASPYAVFTVTAVEGQQLLLDLASGNATIGQDTGTQLEYYNGSAWVAYTPGTPITVPSGGTGASNEAVPLLVRVAIQQDLNFEGPESFTLSATYVSSGKEATGTGTILDDGSGNLYGPTNRDGQPDLPGENGVPEGLIKDDDRPLEVAGTTVNESSPFVAWTVSGIQGQALSLELGGGSAIAGTDTGTQLQVWDGDSWENYVPGSLITIPGGASGEPGDLQVRLAVKPDNLAELAETLDLIARNVSGSEFSGTSTILDQGGAVIDPLAKPLTVTDVTVNEGSPYAVFTVGGVEGQGVTLELKSGTALVGTDTGTQLQVFNGSSWVPYVPGSSVTIPSDGDGTAGEPAALLVRVAITNDSPAEGAETFTLTASSGGLSTVGVGTIVDNGTGDLYGPGNTDGQPDQPGENGLSLDLVKDNDLGRNPSVNDVEVNEGSPYVVYTIEGVPGAGVTLSLVDGSSEPADHGSGIEVFDPLLDAWVAYDPATTVIPEDGVLLARVALNNDAPFEGPETLGLEVTYNANGETDGITVGGAGTGTATILDDGTGEIFLTNEDDPGTPEDESNLGVNDPGEPEIDRFSAKDDDRPLSISDVEVNEASPYAVFTVTAVEGQQLLLDLASGNATIGQDTGTQLEYYNGSAWVAYTPGTPITVPSGGTGASNEAVPLLVRVAIQQDLNFEGPESFNLIATYPSSGKEATGTGTIFDDGSGNLYGPANIDGQPDQPGESGLPVDLIKDDDRPLEVTGTTVNENSPFVAWTVSGIQGQVLSLELGAGTATVGIDTGTQLQVFNGTAWVDYIAGSRIVIPGITPGVAGDLQVRLAVLADNAAELAETLDLVAINAGGSEFTGTSTILDEGGAVIDPSALPLTVNDVTVNEASPYAVFTVGGLEGQPLTLELSSGSATLGVDTGTQLEVFNGSSWVPYVPGSSVTIPSDGDATEGEPANLLVRVAIINDSPAEGAETFTLTASSGGLNTSGEGTIVDDGTGDLFGPNNRDGQPDQPGENGLPVDLIRDNDLGRHPAVKDIEVNEASPYAVFTITGVPGAGVTLSLSNGTAEPDDHGSTIEVFDPVLKAWVAFDPETTVIPESGELLARVVINNDLPFEGPETFTLSVVYNDEGVTNGVTVGGSSTGVATIVDDGTGVIFLAKPDDPSTPANDANLGVNDLGEPEIDRFSPKDDDRPLSISDVEVNESSPYAVFTVTAVEGQPLLLDLASGSATLGQDTATQLEVFNGSEWVAYTPGTPFTVPNGGTAAANEAVPLLVRVAINQDVDFEGPDSFTLTATYARGGKEATGTGMIFDDGTGNLYGPTNTDGQPDQPGEAGLPEDLIKDDDRLLPRLIPTDDGKGLKVIGNPGHTLWVDLSAVMANASLQNGYDLIKVAVDGERSRLGAIGATPDSAFFGDNRYQIRVGEEIRFTQVSGELLANTQPELQISGEDSCIIIGLDDNGLADNGLAGTGLADNGDDGDANDLVLKVKTSITDPYPLNTLMARHQKGSELAYLDLSWIGEDGVTITLDVNTDCGQLNTIALVKVDTDASGNPLGTVSGLAPSAGAAFDAAVRDNLLSYRYSQTGTQTLTAPALTLTAEEAGIYAPVLMTESGGLYTFGSSSSSDGRQHQKVLGANSFAFEDAPAGKADWDFNDTVVSFKVEDPSSPKLVLSDDGQGLTVVAGTGPADGLWLDLNAVLADAGNQNSFDLVRRNAAGSLTQIGTVGATSRGTFLGGKELFLGVGESLRFVQNSNDDASDLTPSLRFTQIGERFRVALNDDGGSSADIDYNDLVVDIDRTPLNPCEEVVKLASLQRASSDGLLDLTGIGEEGLSLKLSILTDSGNVNRLRFVRVGNDPLTGQYTVGGVSANGGEAFRNAVRDNLVDFQVSAGGKGTSESALWNLEAADSGIYAAVLLTPDDKVFTFGDSTGADGRQHLKVLGDSSFGFEDALASEGSDFDYNDFVVKITPV